MSNPTLCRVCLASDIKMLHIANTRYQEIFEKLLTKLCTEDGRPQTLCYMCFSQLQRCSRFMDMAAKTEEILTQLLHSGIGINKDTIHILHRKFTNKLIQTPLQYISVNTVHKTIKKENEDSNIKVESVNVISDHSDQIKERKEIEDYTAEKTIKKENDVLTNVKVGSVNNLVSEEHQINATDIIEDEFECNMVQSNENCDIGIVKQEIEDEINEIEDQVNASEASKGLNEAINFTEKRVNEMDDYSKAVKKEVKEELESDSSLEAAEQEDPEESSYQEISITNLQPRERHACPYCSKSYGQKCHLNRHMKSHRSKEYTCEACCEVCGMRFSQKSTFKKHYLIHTKEKPFACQICPARCTQKIDLDRHMMKHTGQKPFTCDICQQTFSRKCNLKLHILTHSDSKPFVCHVCNSTFSRRYDLNRHKKRKHTGEKPYACDKCDFRSVNASYVKTHIENKHWKERVLKTFSCEECDFKCGTANYLKIHMQKKH